MHLTVFGASGKVGRLVVAECLKRGHHVVAFTHRSNSLPGEGQFENPQNLTIVQGDIHESEHVSRAITGSHAVLSTLGSWGTKHKDVVSTGMRMIIPAMEQQGTTRIVSLTGTEALDAGDKPSMAKKMARFGAKLFAGKILRDGEEHIRLLRNSSLEWTALRSPVMTNDHDITYTLTLTPRSPLETVPRIAVAKAMVDQIEGPAYDNAAPFIYRQRSRF